MWYAIKKEEKETISNSENIIVVSVLKLKQKKLSTRFEIIMLQFHK